MQMFLIQFETHNVVNGIEVDHGPITLQTRWHLKDDKALIHNFPLGRSTNLLDATIKNNLRTGESMLG